MCREVCHAFIPACFQPVVHTLRVEGIALPPPHTHTYIWRPAPYRSACCGLPAPVFRPFGGPRPCSRRCHLAPRSSCSQPGGNVALVPHSSRLGVCRAERCNRARIGRLTALFRFPPALTREQAGHARGGQRCGHWRPATGGVCGRWWSGQNAPPSMQARAPVRAGVRLKNIYPSSDGLSPLDVLFNPRHMS